MINTKEIQGIIRDYTENPYSNKLSNLEEMETFLDTCDHPKLNHEDTNHLNSSIARHEIEAAIKILPEKETFKEVLIPALFSHFHEIKREGTFPNSFYKAIPKLDRDTTKKTIIGQYIL
jgi:hypothetical protein